MIHFTDAIGGQWWVQPDAVRAVAVAAPTAEAPGPLAIAWVEVGECAQISIPVATVADILDDIDGPVPA